MECEIFVHHTDLFQALDLNCCDWKDILKSFIEL